MMPRDVQSAMGADAAQNLIIYQDNQKQIERAFNQSYAAALEEIGLKAERYAKLETPVDTGRLRNSITHALDLSDNAVYIGTNVEYAPYVEAGRHVNGKLTGGVHMLMHAASEHGQEYKDIVEKHLKTGERAIVKP